MRTMKKATSALGCLVAIIAVALILAALTGCHDVQGLGRVDANNPTARVDSLFTHGRCTVYRFDDGGYSHYYADCGASNSVEESKRVSCGKACTRLEADVLISQRRDP